MNDDNKDNGKSVAKPQIIKPGTNQIVCAHCGRKLIADGKVYALPRNIIERFAVEGLRQFHPVVCPDKNECYTGILLSDQWQIASAQFQSDIIAAPNLPGGAPPNMRH